MKLKDRKIAVLGYGSQGRAITLNLIDSGCKVTVGLRPKSKSRNTAKRDRVPVAATSQAVRDADLVIVALPDHVHGTVLTEPFFAQMIRKPAFVFLHGSSIHFELVRPPEKFPVLLLAPHAPGLAVRRNFRGKIPFSAFYAVHRGQQKKGKELLFQLARHIGIPASHLIRTTFADEAVGDLFGEQAVLCGGLAMLLKHGFETLVDAGLPASNAYLEVAFQLDLIVELVKQHGLAGMLDRISPLARYGAVTNGPKVVPKAVRKNMDMVLKEIQSGSFVRRMAKDKAKVTAKARSRLVNSAFDRQARKFGDKSTPADK